MGHIEIYRSITYPVLLLNPFPIFPAHNASHPVSLREIPRNGLADAVFESRVRLPAELVADLARVKRVAPVVARAVFDKGDE